MGGWLEPKPGLSAAKKINVYRKMFSIKSAVRNKEHKQATPNYFSKLHKFENNSENLNFLAQATITNHYSVFTFIISLLMDEQAKPGKLLTKRCSF
jgi:hypothetical protein